MKKLLVLVYLWLLFAPAPWGIALNHQTKQCAGYWAGDEYGRRSLPSGWRAYYPDYASRPTIIQTEIGSCQWDSTGLADRKKQAEECCRQLGYSYVSGNIGTDRPTLYTVIIMVLVGGAVLLVIGLVVAGLVGLFAGGRWLWKRGKKKQ